MDVKKYKDGVYKIEYKDGSGKRHRNLIKGSRTFAEEVLKKKLAEAAEGKYFPDRIKRRITFKEIAEQYWKLHGSLTKSAPKMIYNYNIIVAHFGNKKISDITSSMIQEFYNQKVIERTSSTANRYFTLTRAIINYGLKNKLYIGENPCDSISRKPDNPSRTRYLTDTEMKLFINNAPENMRPLFAFALMTGMRRGEILNLTWQDIDLSAHFIHVHETKSNKSREVPIMEGVWNILKNYPISSNGRIFNFTIPQIKYAFKKALRLSGIKNFKFHDLRHTFASHFMMNGGDINILQRILGHSSSKMTMRYSHLSKNFLLNSIKNLEVVMPKDISFSNKTLLPNF